MALLELRDLSVEYPTAAGTVRAVDRVSVDVDAGEIVGVVGESGSGKTSLVLATLRLLPPPGRLVSGTIGLDGQNLRDLTPLEMRRLRGRRVAYVPQAAMGSLNPVITVGRQIGESLMLHTELEGSAARARIAEVLEMVDLEGPVSDRYPHELSGGMRQRAVIAMALAPRPQLLLADEPTSGLDVLVRAQILSLLRRLVADLGLALLMVSHDLRLVARWSDRAVVMYAGRVMEEGPASTLLSASRHPYPVALARSLPNLRGPLTAGVPIAGEAPDLTQVPSGCPFHPRCPSAVAACSEREPLLVLRDGHRVACHLFPA
ncbi:MAG TPA: ABC transporter ATP-binding protein [Acidimicrobiales bacterium]|nr:ABC transporter ATP-binding protein [Acidimicrobiales bacterium]